MSEVKLYNELADWFHLLTAPADYAEEAEFYRRRMEEVAERPLREVLELGSGGGNNASHMKAHVSLTLVDLSPQMLAQSRTINPECEHVEGDMRSVRLGRDFDAVFVQDAVSYLTNEEDLRAAIETAWVHCRPGGAVLFAPDDTRENFRPETEHGGHDGPDGRGLRYVDWTWDPDPSDSTYVSHFAYLLREADGSVRTVYDRHEFGLFSRETWLRLLEESGFDARVVPFEHSELEPGSYEVFVGVRRAGQ